MRLRRATLDVGCVAIACQQKPVTGVHKSKSSIMPVPGRLQCRVLRPVAEYDYTVDTVE